MSCLTKEQVIIYDAAMKEKLRYYQQTGSGGFTAPVQSQMEPFNSGNNKSTLLSPETIQSFSQLTDVLRSIHHRLISEGYSILEGRLYSPEGELIYENKNYYQTAN
jgi:hypothetical protein